MYITKYALVGLGFIAHFHNVSVPCLFTPTVFFVFYVHERY